MKHVIIGGVAAGMSAAARLRRLSETDDIVIIERGDYISYANCGLPYYIGDTIKERDRLLVQTPEAFTKRFNVEVRTGHEAVGVDTAAGVVRVKNRSTAEDYAESYDRLLLAPGGSPVRPPLPGGDHPRIHTLWTIPDTDRLRTLVDTGAVRSALVVGAGFIGLEMVENLHARGISVTVVEALDQALGVIDYEMAAIVHRELRMKDIAFITGETVVSFADAADAVSARLSGGRTIDADLVLLSVGVRPNTGFLAGSGIALGPRGHIVVDPHLRTNVPNVFAAGDAIEVVNPLTGKQTAIPLAGPANKQGRIAAENMTGRFARTYDGTLGTAIAKVFDLSVAVTGATEKFCRGEKIAHGTVIVHPNDHAGYYPGATGIALKLVYSTETRRVLGAQAVGYVGVDKRIDVIATAIRGRMTVDDLAEFEHAYAPPYSSAKDPVNMAGFAAQNALDGLVSVVTWGDIRDGGTAEKFLLDVRTPEEFTGGSIPGAVNIPLDALRSRIAEIPRDREIVVFCQVGLRGYLAARILAENGIANCANLSGGYLTYQLATAPPEGGRAQLTVRDDGTSIAPAAAAPAGKTVEVNACGLQCPGPVMRLRQEMDLLAPGDVLTITASDAAFYHDVQSWARTTGNTIRTVAIEKGIVRAELEKGSAHVVHDMPAGGTDKTIIVFSADLDRVIAAFVIANGAVAMGRKVTMFFTFWGLNVLRRPQAPSVRKSLVEAAFGMMMPRGSRKLSLSKMSMGGIGDSLIRGIMRDKNVPSLEEMIGMAVRSGIDMVACQMSMELMGIRQEELIEGVRFGGVATYLEASEKADNNLFI